MSTPDDASRFEDPKLAINRVYTKKGDGGGTSLVGGQKVEKSAPRIEAYGTVDELNAFVGVAREAALAAARSGRPATGRSSLEGLAASLLRVQHELFNLGSLLATLPEDLHEKQARVTQDDVAMLEREMDEANALLDPLRSFVLPGGSGLNAALHVARTVCRRAEREVVRLAAETTVDPLAVIYLNRLSDAFFVWSRHASRLEEAPEVLWAPNASASGAARG